MLRSVELREAKGTTPECLRALAGGYGPGLRRVVLTRAMDTSGAGVAARIDANATGKWTNKNPRTSQTRGGGATGNHMPLTDSGDQLRLRSSSQAPRDPGTS